MQINYMENNGGDDMIKMINAHDSNVCADINQNLTEDYKMKTFEGNGKIQIF